MITLLYGMVISFRWEIKFLASKFPPGSMEKSLLPHSQPVMRNHMYPAPTLNAEVKSQTQPTRFKKYILPTRDFIKLCGRWTLENSTSEWNLVSDLVYALWEGQEWAETLTKQWPGKWCRQGAFVCRDKAGDAGPGQERETDRARGQGNVVESPQGLLGKCSWMTAFWNVHKWRVLIG